MNNINNKFNIHIPGILYLLLAVIGFYIPYVIEMFSTSLDPEQCFFNKSETEFFLKRNFKFYFMNII